MNFTLISAITFASLPLVYVAFNGLGKSSGQYPAGAGDVVLPILCVCCFPAAAVLYMSSC